MPRKKKKHDTTPKYPWDQWFAKPRSITITKGKDFKCQVHGMAAQIRNAAARRGVTVGLDINGNTITFTVTL